MFPNSWSLEWAFNIFSNVCTCISVKASSTSQDSADMYISMNKFVVKRIVNGVVEFLYIRCCSILRWAGIIAHSLNA